MSSSAPKESERRHSAEILNPLQHPTAEEANRQAQAQLEAVFQAVSDGIAVCDMSGHIVLVNEACARMNGYGSAAEIHNDLAHYQRIHELRTMQGETVPPAEWPISKALRGESLTNWELYARRKDTGQESFFSFSAAPIRDAAGHQILAVVTTRDVTLAKKAEEALRHSEERFRTLADNISQFAWMANANGWIFWYNRRWYEYTGTNLEEMQGWGWKKVHHPDHVERVVERFSRSVQAGETWEDTFPLRGKDGNYRWFLSRAMPIRDHHGQVVRWFGTNTDITEQREAEQALRESEQRFRALVNAGSDLVYRMSPDWEDMRHIDGTGFNVDKENPRKDWLRAYIYPDDRAKVLNAIQHAMQTKSSFALEHRVRLADGGLGWALSRAVPLLNDKGEITEWFGATSDITARKQGEDALVRSEKLASVGRMAATIAHEINNPLAAVMNLLYLARHNKDCPEIVKQDLVKAEGELKRVSHITRQVLGFHRDFAAKRRVSLASVLDEALELFETKIAARQVKLEKRYSDTIHITAVGGELRQAVSNLIANSLDAIPDGGTIKLRLSEFSRDRKRLVRVTVADNGDGIDRAALPHIFEPLFTTKESVGTGLGLWVSKQLVEKHGGSIRFRSSTNPERRGTTFSIVLPDS